MEKLGYNKVIVRSDQEPAIVMLKSAVKREMTQSVICEESIVGESPSLGGVNIQVHSATQAFVQQSGAYCDDQSVFKMKGMFTITVSDCNKRLLHNIVAYGNKACSTIAFRKATEGPRHRPLS